MSEILQPGATGNEKSAMDVIADLRAQVDKLTAENKTLTTERDEAIKAIQRCVDNIDKWRATGIPADAEESKSIYEQLCAALARHTLTPSTDATSPNPETPAP